MTFSVGRTVNLLVGVALSASLVKLSWNVVEINFWFWTVFSTMACYGLGAHTFSKWLEVVKLKAGGK